MSMRIRSKAPERMASTASTPFGHAVAGLQYEHFEQRVSATRRLVALSSAISTRVQAGRRARLVRPADLFRRVAATGFDGAGRVKGGDLERHGQAAAGV